MPSPARVTLLLLLLLLLLSSNANAQRRNLIDSPQHLRNLDDVEWSEFSQETDGSELLLDFQSKGNDSQWTLGIRHRDVKQRWTIELNGQRLGTFPADNNGMHSVWPVKKGLVKAGENSLTVSTTSDKTDDVLLEEIWLDSRSRGEIFSQCKLQLTVRDQTGKPTPGRFTLVDPSGSLVVLGTESNQNLAIRRGFVYTGNGQASLDVAPGKYTIVAGRGFEYSIDRQVIEVAAGETVERDFKIKREVDTRGFVGCDPHVHTFTYSRHGDATVEERILTIVGEGIELPIATDHNVQIDYEAMAQKMNLRSYFTPVVGNEVTTKLGHFNVFPLDPKAPVPNHQAGTWDEIFDSIFASPKARVVILNHARDVHGGFLPFDAENHNSVVGENIHGWNLRANAMELVNSGATQTDPLELHHDWFGLLNRGLKIAPIGSSDSHEVLRKFVGQSRTYIRCPDDDVSQIDVELASKNLLAGRASMSMGLLTEITVNGKDSSGDLAAVDSSYQVRVRVQGPTWTEANRLNIYANGILVKTVSIPGNQDKVVKLDETFELKTPQHDVHLVAIATGPGIDEAFWRVPKPYLPDSLTWNSYLIGTTGPVWIDADGDGKWSSAYDYAEQLLKQHDREIGAIVEGLAEFDEATTAQVLHRLARSGSGPIDDEISEAFSNGADSVQKGYGRYLKMWRENQAARLKQ